MIASMKASYARGEQALQTAKKLQAEARAAIEATRASARKALEQDAGNTGFLATFGRALGGAGGAGGISPGTAQANRLSRDADRAQAALDKTNKAIAEAEDRKSVVEGKRVSERV